MHIARTNEFLNFKDELDKIARGDRVAHLKDDVALNIVKKAQEVPKEYVPALSVKKGKDESAKGALTAIVGAVAYKAVKTQLTPYVDFSPEIETALSGAISAGIAAIFHGIQTAFWNWKKHRKIKNK